MAFYKARGLLLHIYSTLSLPHLYIPPDVEFVNCNTSTAQVVNFCTTINFFHCIFPFVLDKQCYVFLLICSNLVVATITCKPHFIARVTATWIRTEDHCILTVDSLELICSNLMFHLNLLLVWLYPFLYSFTYLTGVGTIIIVSVQWKSQMKVTGI